MSVEVNKTTPRVAPSPFETWKETGYENVAAADWKHWEGIEDEHLKHFQVELDPKDVEAAQRGAFWNLFTDFKTAVPAILVIGFPLVGQGHIIMDWHVEAAAIFWTVAFGLSAVAKDGLFNAMSAGPEARRSEVLEAEAGYTKAIRDTMLAHERTVALPGVMAELNSALAHLHQQEAKAATVQVKLEHHNKMVAMLDYLVATQASQAADSGSDLVVRAAVDATEDKLATDKAFASKVLDEAIAAFAAAEAAPKTALSDEFVAQLAKFEANPPEDPSVDPEAEEAKSRALFEKRFGYDVDTVTEAMMKKAQTSPIAKAYLTARCGGAEPAVGVPIVERSPIDF